MDKCPKCSIGRSYCKDIFACGTMVDDGKVVDQSTCCRIRRLTAENARLREELDATNRALSDWQAVGNEALEERDRLRESERQSREIMERLQLAWAQYQDGRLPHGCGILEVIEEIVSDSDEAAEAGRAG